MILIHQLPALESQAQECLLLKSLLQNLHAGYNSVLSPHLACISAFIKSRIGKVITIEESKSWDDSLLKAYESLCFELEKLFLLVVNDAAESSVLVILS